MIRRLLLGLEWGARWLFYALGMVAIGSLLGSLLFLVLGPLLTSRPLSSLLPQGARDGAFYVGLWAPGGSLVLCVVRAHTWSRQGREAPRVQAQRRRSRRVLLGLAGLLVLPLLLFSAVVGCVSFSLDPEGVAERMEASGHAPPREHRVDVRGRTLYVAESGQPEGVPLVLLHGSPGSWDNFLGVIVDADLQARTHILGPDRPGFGATGGAFEPSLAEQSALIMGAVEGLLRGRRAIWMGHSLGGPLAARLAVDYPAQTAGLLLIAPSIDPQLEALRWYNHAASWRLWNWMLPRALLNSNREILPLRAELLAMEPLLPTVTAPVWVVQGARDNLVDPLNARFVEEAFTHAPVTVLWYEDLDHLIPFKQPGVIVEALQGLLAEVAAKPTAAPLTPASRGRTE